MVWLPDGEKNLRYVYSFWHDPRTWRTYTERERERQTHTQTPHDDIGRACIASRAKKSWLSKVHKRHYDVCCQALLAKRLGVRLVVYGVATWQNMTQHLSDIASSDMDFYRVNSLTNDNYNALAVQLARDICATLRQFK